MDGTKYLGLALLTSVPTSSYLYPYKDTPLFIIKEDYPCTGCGKDDCNRTRYVLKKPDSVFQVDSRYRTLNVCNQYVIRIK